jgi:hypothetical protein
VALWAAKVAAPAPPQIAMSVRPTAHTPSTFPAISWNGLTDESRTSTTRFAFSSSVDVIRAWLVPTIVRKSTNITTNGAIVAAAVPALPSAATLWGRSAARVERRRAVSADTPWRRPISAFAAASSAARRWPSTAKSPTLPPRISLSGIPGLFSSAEGRITTHAKISSAFTRASSPPRIPSRLASRSAGVAPATATSSTA